jgi:hypothetical protein
VDQDDKPIPGEEYEVTDSTGRIKRGHLDQNGFAHVTGISPGMCQITFPKLDITAWERAT